MSSLRFVCPNRNAMIHSGVEIDPKSFTKCREERVALRCPLCNEVHEFQVAEGQIDELRIAYSNAA